MLRAEREDILKEKQALLGQVAQLQHYHDTIDELQSELMQLGSIDPYNEHGSREYAGGEAKESPSPSATSTSTSLTHALWTSLPSIRNLSPALYNRIRSMAADLSRVENECKQKDSRMRVLDEERRHLSSDQTVKLSHMSQAIDNAESTVITLTSKLQRAEEELSYVRHAKVCNTQLPVLYPRNLPRSLSLSIPPYTL